TLFKYWKSRDGYQKSCGELRSRHVPQGLKFRGVKPPTWARNTPARLVHRNICSPWGAVSSRLRPAVSARHNSSASRRRVSVRSVGEVAITRVSVRRASASAAEFTVRIGREESS